MIVHRAKRIALPLLAAAALACGGAKSGSPGTGSTAGTSPSAPVDTTSPGTTTGTMADASTLVAYEPMPPDTGTAPLPVLLGAGTTAPSAPSAGTPSIPAAASGLGVFTVSMVDAPNPTVDELWVIVESVTAHVAGLGWVKLTMPVEPVYVDLLTLKTSEASETAVKLGFLTLPAGTITQIRLLIGHDEFDQDGKHTRWNHVVLAGNEPKQEVQLKVPSGFETGVKIIGPWTIAACEKTDVTIDFDGKKSIWYHPNGHETEWILRPVIRVHGVVTGPTVCPDPATDSVTPPAGGVTPPTDGGSTTPPLPKSNGDTCSAATECSSGICTGGVCTAPPPAPKADGASCSAPAECSSGNCYGGVCTATQPPAPKADGASCSASTECSSGICTGGVCTAPPPPPTKVFGDPCIAPTECTSGSCIANQCSGSSAGTTCVHDAECTSNVCYQSSCAQSPAGGSCTAATDCSTNVCSGGTCGAGSTLPVGASCTSPTECTSNQCSGTAGAAGTCQPGLQGAICTTYEDCATGLRCAVDPGLTTGTCQSAGSK